MVFLRRGRASTPEPKKSRPPSLRRNLPGQNDQAIVGPVLCPLARAKARPLQGEASTLGTRLQTTGAGHLRTNTNSIRRGRKHAIVSHCLWYKISFRPTAPQSAEASLRSAPLQVFFLPYLCSFPIRYCHIAWFRKIRLGHAARSPLSLRNVPLIRAPSRSSGVPSLPSCFLPQ
jgi:hypothetical protein